MFIHILYDSVKSNPKELERFLNSSTYLNASTADKLIYRERLGLTKSSERN